MDRVALFVDAGYFFAAGAEAAFGSKIDRKNILLRSPKPMIEQLCAQACDVADGLPLLRTYWYDGMRGTHMSHEQTKLAMLPNVKLRLGTLNGLKEQKGVDSSILSDLIDLATKRGMADAVLVTGDADLLIGIKMAQSLGVRVHILGVDGGGERNVSTLMQMEADTMATIPAHWFKEHFSRGDAEQIKFIAEAKPQIVHEARLVPVATAGIALNEDDSLNNDFVLIASKVVEEIYNTLSEQEIRKLQRTFRGSNLIPSAFDGRLVATASARTGNRLHGDQPRIVRGMFIRAIRECQIKGGLECA